MDRPVLPRPPGVVEDWEFWLRLGQAMGLTLRISSRVWGPDDPVPDAEALLSSFGNRSRIPFEDVRQHPHGVLRTDLEPVTVLPGEGGALRPVPPGRRRRDLDDARGRGLPRRAALPARRPPQQGDDEHGRSTDRHPCPVVQPGAPPPDTDTDAFPTSRPAARSNNAAITSLLIGPAAAVVAGDTRRALCQDTDPCARSNNPPTPESPAPYTSTGSPRTSVCRRRRASPPILIPRYIREGRSATHLLHSRYALVSIVRIKGMPPAPSPRLTRCHMVDRDPSPDEASTCPNCGGVVVYRGVGRRPVWCSTRCRNDAALQRLGARKGAIEIRIVEIPRTRAGAQPPDATTTSSDPMPSTGPEPKRAAPSIEQALRTIRNDPQAVGKLLAHLERRRANGNLSAYEWLPVRNALRLITRELTPDVERPPPATLRPPAEQKPPGRS
ncbi:hypothetical protein GCM10027026_19540 [Myroides odoratimimus subsp. xuanwuensis]